MSVAVDVDRNLLVAVIALQDDLIDQSQFADVCAGWALRLDRPMAELLSDRGWITPDDRQEIERKIERKLKKHKGDIRASLGAVAGGGVRDLIRSINNPQLRQSLAGLAPAAGHVRLETLMPAPESVGNTTRYSLTRLYAEGGLGKVWLAIDRDLNREVALKEVKAVTEAGAEASRRFLKEAQITGQLEHPNIVPVYELARRPEDDQPFYTMRFVRGETLRDVIQAFHKQRGGKAPDELELQRQLLEPFIKVCQAIGYAHSRGVVHRDLKPENVVIGSHGEVVVLDWGLAKLIDQPEEPVIHKTLEASVSLSAEIETAKTQGQVGTPSYMAPEQVEGRHDLINQRTDVYGLGAILFEMLTNHPPAEAPTLGEVFRKIQLGLLPKARELEATVPKPLEAICAKAMAQSQSARYQQAEELAEDVRRWLLDQPVSVYRDPFAVQIVRWARRHQALVASLTALLLTAVVALTVGVLFVNREREHTEAQRLIAVENAGQALHNLRLAQNAADGLLAEVADVDLADIPQMESVRQRLLEKAEADYMEFLIETKNDPLVLWGAARSRVRLGDIKSLLGNTSEAQHLYEEAIQVLATLTKNAPDNTDYREDLARAYQGFGTLLKESNRFEAAEKAIREAIRLREAIAALPNAKPEDEQSLADSRYLLGTILARRGAKGAEDIDAYRAALDVQQRLVQENENRPEFRTRLARFRNNFAMLEKASGKTAEAEKTFVATLALLQDAIKGSTALPGPRWQFARAANNLGAILIEQKRLDEAAARFKESCAILETLTEEFPAVTQYRHELASILVNLGLFCQRTGKSAEAVDAYRKAVTLLETLCTKFPKSPIYRQKRAQARVILNAALSESNPSEAVEGLRTALQEQMALLADFPDVPEYQRELGRSHYLLARLLVNLKKSTEAVEQAESAAKLHRLVLDSRPASEADQKLLLEDQVLFAIALIDANRLTEAANAAESVVEIRPDDLVAYIHAAALLTRCASTAQKSSGLENFAEEAQARAVKVLRSAASRHLVPPGSRFEVPELRPLQDRDDFKRLLETVSQPARTG